MDERLRRHAPWSTWMNLASHSEMSVVRLRDSSASSAGGGASARWCEQYSRTCRGASVSLLLSRTKGDAAHAQPVVVTTSGRATNSPRRGRQAPLKAALETLLMYYT